MTVLEGLRRQPARRPAQSSEEAAASLQVVVVQDVDVW
jgi:hypothetical protein